MNRYITLTVLTLSATFFVNCGEETPTGEPPREEPGYYDDVGTMWQITDLPGEETNPTWSPDGTKIAFQYESEGVTEVYILDIDNNNITRLTYNHGENPSWSPDGSLILYDGIDENYIRAIYTIDPAGGDPTFITKGIEDYEYEGVGATDACWFPEMDRIAFSSKSVNWFYENAQGLYFLDLPDGEPELYIEPNYYQYYRESAVSPDGDYIAYHFDQNADPTFYDEYIDRLSVDDIQTHKNIFRDETVNPSPAWSPDGSEIAYIDKHCITNQGYYYDIFIYSFSEGKKRRVTDVFSCQKELGATPAWSPDGTKIAFAAKYPYGNYDLWIVELNQR